MEMANRTKMIAKTSRQDVIFIQEFNATQELVFEAISFDVQPDERTRVTERVVFLSVADRDGMVGSGMEMGMVQSHERLDELLAKILVEDSL